MNNRRYYSLNDYFKETMGEKIYKVSLDGGFTCPNRDGKAGYGGCTFCSEDGSGEFAGNRRKTITEQIDEQLEFLKGKIGDKKVIAYFQNFTNTYGNPEYLRKIYLEALNHPRVIGLAIGTRADCLEDEIVKLLDEINNNYLLWVEIGLQTSNDETAEAINRGYPFSTYEKAASALKSRNIKFVTHMIVGLPNEEKKDILKTAEAIIESGAWGIKIHLLYIVKGTRMHSLYIDSPFKVFEQKEYVEIVADILELLPEKMVVHRLTGDGTRETLAAPLWALNKRGVLNSIEMELKRREEMKKGE